MARANRHYLPGMIWHITHRCHQKQFLLKFARDKRRWIHWLFEARQRFGTTVLNYTVTSNHIHLVLADDKERATIPKTIQLIAGRCAQEYNKRKNRKGAFWEDRYHATAVESGRHLMTCLAYVDLNMVRAGVVDHPKDWLFGGYNEIRKPRRKNVIIAYEKLAGACGYDTYKSFLFAHDLLVEKMRVNPRNRRSQYWSSSVAVGDDAFISEIKSKLGVKAKGRKPEALEDRFALREDIASYNALSDTENSDIAQENTYNWNQLI